MPLYDSVCIRENPGKIVRTLLAHETNTEIRDDFGLTPLLVIARSPFVELTTLNIFVEY